MHFFFSFLFFGLFFQKQFYVENVDLDVHIFT